MRTAIAQTLAVGKKIYADVHAAQLNPLNQRPIGIDRNKYKGIVQVTGVTENDLELRVVHEFLPPAGGDIVTRFRTPTPHGTEATIDEVRNEVWLQLK